MKKALRKWMMATFLLVSMLSINTSKAQGSVSLQVFYDELQPYGTWLEYGNFGYVWIPNVDRDFTPYATNGYWINTEYGNTWVSDYAWGWAPFHYGRWFYDDFHGWIWIPDTEWAPAWVAWRSGGGYYGWAPLMPGFHISVSFNYYNNIPHHYWSFVPYRYITYRTVHHHCVPRPQIINIINHTTIVTHNHYDDRRRNTFFTGPSLREIERTNHERVEVYKISDRSRPGRSDFERGSVSFYKPEIDNSHHGRTRPAPSRIVKDDRGRNENRLMFESRGERPSEFRNNRTNSTENFHRSEIRNGNAIEQQPVERGDERRTFNPSDRSPSRQQENNRSSDKHHEGVNQGQHRFNQQERSQQVERQHENPKVHREYSGQNNQRRMNEQPQLNSIGRQPANRLDVQRERSSFNPNSNRSSESHSQREQQIRRSSSDHRSSQPSHFDGSKGNSSRKRD